MVNVEELRAQIAGANLAIRAMEAELDEDRHWNSQHLLPLVDRLARLITRANDLALIRELIPDRQRPAISRIRSQQTSISQLAARISQARSFAGSSDFPGSEAQRLTELKRLDELSRTLVRLAVGSGQWAAGDGR